MNIAIVAPSPVPFVIGGAEKFWWGLVRGISEHSPHFVELVKQPSKEDTFWDLMRSYQQFSHLDLSHFDAVVSTKYPAWMVQHPRHIVYLQHKLRGLYDTYHFTGLPTELPKIPGVLQPLVTLLRQAPRQRHILPEFFETLFSYEQRQDLAPYFAFPGPLVRAIVHFLDDVALHPDSIHAYAAISHNVTKRQNYFPPQQPVTVIHHPSDLERFACRPEGDYIFTTSRLVHTKRLHLIVDAMRYVQEHIELRIGGTGPELPALQQLAGDDHRIRFLGYVPDNQLVDLYAGAQFVPFAPYDEDYGLITIEAMASGKPVLTTWDSGGVNEFVDNGVTGATVAPDAKALGLAMQRLAQDPDLCRAMGQEARRKVAHITWKHTVKQLLALAEPASASSASRRPRIVVATTFPVYPPTGGGPKRIYHLYRHVAQQADVTLVTQGPGNATAQRQLAPGLSEICLPRSPEQIEHQHQLHLKTGQSVDDIAAITHAGTSPLLLRTLRDQLRQADLAIASHPFLYFVLRQVYSGPLWYESHNVEADMKEVVLGKAQGAKELLQLVRRVEAACCHGSNTIFTCSPEDEKRLRYLYKLPADKAFFGVPNGVDTQGVPFVNPAQRRHNKQQLAAGDTPLALFMGSLHRPNMEAVAHIKDIAPQAPQVTFLIMGSVCRDAVCSSLPGNVKIVGEVSEEEKNVILGAVDIGLNPMTSGSGTNLKVLEYAAAGLVVLTTPFGLRGLQLTPSEHVIAQEVAHFSHHLRQIAAWVNGDSTASDYTPMLNAARQQVEQQYDWQVLAQHLVEQLPTMQEA